MARAYSVDLRVRVVKAVEGGLSTRQAAARFGIGIATAGTWCRLFRGSGSVEAGRQGNPGRSKLDVHAGFILGLIEDTKDIALHEIVQQLADVHGVTVQPSTVWYFLDKHGVTFKKRQRTLANRRARTLPQPAKTGSKGNPISIPPA